MPDWLLITPTANAGRAEPVQHRAGPGDDPDLLRIAVVRTSCTSVPSRSNSTAAIGTRPRRDRESVPQQAAQPMPDGGERDHHAGGQPSGETPRATTRLRVAAAGQAGFGRSRRSDGQPRAQRRRRPGSARGGRRRGRGRCCHRGHVPAEPPASGRPPSARQCRPCRARISASSAAPACIRTLTRPSAGRTGCVGPSPARINCQPAICTRSARSASSR